MEMTNRKTHSLNGHVSTKSPMNRQTKVNIWDSMNFYVLRNYDKFVNMLTNPIIINYLKNRYDDSRTLLETVQRIRFGVEKKPICAREGCNKPVVWVGKKSLMMRTHCCLSCAGLDEKTHEKRLETCEKVW